MDMVMGRVMDKVTARSIAVDMVMEGVTEVMDEMAGIAAGRAR
jgi:hypothetical protein